MVEKQKENDGLYLRFIEFAMGIGIGHSKEVINHHAPQTPHANANSALKQGERNRLAYSKAVKRASKGTVMSFTRVFSGEGAIENFRFALN